MANVLTAMQLGHFFSDIPARILPDRDYACPVESWLFGPFADFYSKMLRQWNIANWASNWDCNRYATLYHSLAQVCHGRTADAPSEGIAVGKVHYTTRKGGGHAINIAVTSPAVDVIFVEPQDQNQVTLTQQERASIWLVEF